MYNSIDLIKLTLIMSALFFGCSPVDIEDKDANKKYVLSDFCFETYTTIQDSLNGIRKRLNCTDMQMHLEYEMSTIILTKDSIVRYGYHCPGNNSGSTRISYGYVLVEDSVLIGDSLSGVLQTPNGYTRKTSLLFDFGSYIVIEQFGEYVDTLQPTKVYIYCKGFYVKSEQTRFNISDEPTCIDNYSPCFPIPVW